MRLYHCSPTPGLTVLLPGRNPFFEKPSQVCLTSCLPMALLYGIRHFEYTYGFTPQGGLRYEEYFPGALEALYQGRSATLYLCSLRADMTATRIPNEYVTAAPVEVEQRRAVPDLYRALLDQAEQGALELVLWDRMSPQRRQWVVDTQVQVIAHHRLLEQPDTPYARYIRETYPVSWALALENAQEGDVK